MGLLGFISCYVHAPGFCYDHKAEMTFVDNKTLHIFLGKCLNDIGWNYHQLPREIMALIVQDLEQPLLSYLHKLFFGPSTTKEICESTFSWLHYKVGTTTRNSVMSSKYAYCILSPYTAASGMNQLLPDEDDWHTVKSPAGREIRSTASKFFSIQSTTMPEDVPGLDLDRMDKTWKKAGVVSDERSIAALAYVVHEHDNQWKNISLSWTGRCLFLFLMVIIHKLLSCWFLFDYSSPCQVRCSFKVKCTRTKSPSST